MKYTIAILFLFLFFWECNNKTSNEDERYTIEGKLDGFDEGMIVLSKFSNNKLLPIDSVYAQKGKFKIIGGKVESPELYYLQLGNNIAVIEFFLENSDIKIIANINEKVNAEIKGSKSQNEYASFRENNSVFESRQYDLYLQSDIAKENNDTILLEQLDISYKSVYKEQIAFIKKYVNDNNDSHVAAFLAARSLVDIVGNRELIKIRYNFDISMNKTVYIKELDKIIVTQEKLQIGKQSPDFSLPDTIGKKISLSSLQGKYVLLNFWMSKSEKSRTQNLYLNKFYEKYKENGLEILNVSLDREHSNWIEAIKKDSINSLKNVIAKDKTLNEIIKSYSLKKLPTVFLLNRKGLIMAKNLSIEEITDRINLELNKNK